MRARYQSAPYDSTGKVDRKINVSGTTESLFRLTSRKGCGAFIFSPDDVKE